MTRKYRHIEDDFCKEAVIFARVSSEKQEKGASIDAQKESVYEYCKNKGLKIIKEFIITESTIRGERKQYKEMLKFVASRTKKTAIVVNCVDRLQRSYKDTPILDDLRKKGLIEVHFLKENLILSKDSRGIDILFWNMCVLMANSYILSLSNNVRRSLEYNWSQGKWQSLAPIGYLNQKDKHGKSIIVIDEERAPIIKRLFEEYATGLHTAQSLLILACKLGLTAKETYSEETPQRKRFISRTKIYEILRNPFYAGIMCVKGKLMPHIHGKIIDKKLYDKVQQIMDAKGMESEIHKHQQKYKVKKFAFRGLVLCGRCHHLMSPDCKTKTNGKQYTYLRCYNKCGQMPINETILLKQLEDEIFSKIQISPTIYNLLKKSITQSIEDEKKINISARKKIDADIAVIDNRLERLWECYLDRDINKARYELEKQKYLEQKKDLQAKAEKFSDISGELKENVTKAMDFVVNLPKLMKIATPDEKNTLLKKLLTNCVLDGKVLKYEIKAPFDKLLSCTNYKKWKDVAMENLEEFGEVE